MLTIVSGLVILLIGSIICFIKYKPMATDYYELPVSAAQNQRASYAGSISCAGCHADIFKTHIETAHLNTSKLADGQSIKASFNKGSNILDIKDVVFTMLNENGAFYQHTKIKNRNIDIPLNKFDIVIGSGVRGQTYLTWKDDKLFQLQPSYHTSSDTWINSLGYPEYFTERPIRGECLKCHVTYAEEKDLSGEGNQFFRESMIYGVDCEKCHGPSLDHVNYQRQDTGETAGFVIKFDTLTRQQRLDVCAQCHSGGRATVQGNPFYFLPGDNLDDYSTSTHEENNATLDVHGNQYGLLTQSECFKQTATMDCASCHDPHKNQRGDTDYFNMKCIGCHSGEKSTCALSPSKMKGLTQGCIGCHMPARPSKTLTAQLEIDSVGTSFYIRTHLIGIYPEEKAIE